MVAGTGPVLLKAENFTPKIRTPWGGQWIVSTLKSAWVQQPLDPQFSVVGESWEISVDDQFLSQIDHDRMTLKQCIALSPERWLGQEYLELHRSQPALVMKIIDAREALSVQIHPKDSDPDLGEAESGKPECWLVIHTDPSVATDKVPSLFVGWKQHETVENIRNAIAHGEDLSERMNRVVVQPGDFFLIEAGTPHAIGAGVTVIEPQRVTPERSGITYRYWDWNRRYASDGTPDVNGAPRALHVERALQVTNWQATGDAWLGKIHTRVDLGLERARVWNLCGTSGICRSDTFEVRACVGSGRVDARDAVPLNRFSGLTVVNGEVILKGDFGSLRVPKGRSAAIPASAQLDTVELYDSRAVVGSAI